MKLVCLFCSRCKPRRFVASVMHEECRGHQYASVSIPIKTVQLLRSTVSIDAEVKTELLMDVSGSRR